MVKKGTLRILTKEAGIRALTSKAVSKVKNLKDTNFSSDVLSRSVDYSTDMATGAVTRRAVTRSPLFDIGRRTTTVKNTDGSSIRNVKNTNEVFTSGSKTYKDGTNTVRSSEFDSPFFKQKNTTRTAKPLKQESIKTKPKSDAPVDTTPRTEGPATTTPKSDGPANTAPAKEVKKSRSRLLAAGAVTTGLAGAGGAGYMYGKNQANTDGLYYE